jgi:translation initiation factor IF-1
MSIKEEKITLIGEVTECLPSTTFRVLLPNGKKIIAVLSGKIRQHFIKIVPGDKVKIEISPYDLTKGRIIFRER